MYLTFAHAPAAQVQRDRRLGRLWRDREPLDHLEPFNLLHRNQMMENEPPEHTRLRRPVARAFARGHVERLRPRVRELAADAARRARPRRLRRDRGLRRAAAGARHRRPARGARGPTRTTCCGGRRLVHPHDRLRPAPQRGHVGRGEPDQLGDDQDGQRLGVLPDDVEAGRVHLVEQRGGQRTARAGAAARRDRG